MQLWRATSSQRGRNTQRETKFQFFGVYIKITQFQHQVPLPVPQPLCLGSSLLWGLVTKVQLCRGHQCCGVALSTSARSACAQGDTQLLLLLPNRCSLAEVTVP